VAKRRTWNGRSGSAAPTNKNYDLTIISHVEPFDLGNFAKPDYYWGYQSAKFNELFNQIKNAARPRPRPPAGRCAKLLADDAVHAFLYQPQWVTVANKNLRAVEGHAGVRERPLGPVLVLR
jgi:peptide/nickel transport system substrate-binding protein